MLGVTISATVLAAEGILTALLAVPAVLAIGVIFAGLIAGIIMNWDAVMNWSNLSDHQKSDTADNIGDMMVGAGIAVASLFIPTCEGVVNGSICIADSILGEAALSRLLRITEQRMYHYSDTSPRDKKQSTPEIKQPSSNTGSSPTRSRPIAWTPSPSAPTSFSPGGTNGSDWKYISIWPLSQAALDLFSQLVYQYYVN